MQAIAKVRPEPGADLINVDEPHVKPGHVKVRVMRTSVCGTDVHIYKWDEWSARRIQPPRIIGHEMCGVVEEVGKGVFDRKPGDYVASESHIVCGHCVQCRRKQAHVCQNTRILGVDVDGVFAPYVVIPAENARPTSRSVPPEVATVQDPLGNAVHTALAGPLYDRSVLVTGCGPIGLFAIGICKAKGARRVIATEVSPYRLNLAAAMGADLLLNPKRDDVAKAVLKETRGVGVDAVLEMSGHPASLHQAIHLVRSGGRISMLGIFPTESLDVDFNEIIFKGIEIQGIVGRKLWDTWDRMYELLLHGLDVTPAITHTFHYTEFSSAMELIQRGECGKVVFHVSD